MITTLGWMCVFCGPAISVASIFTPDIMTRQAVLTVGAVLFMLGDIILLLNAAVESGREDD